ncbi:cytochrome-c peroxidase [Chitinophaga pinensis]|uniref:Cytochrome-c peroxidase n=1 Tax=Chitinophaga pinensis (strain ATCC 43595 / DSM 2588 / LMG 13176 / NBRC 15968 / NCIMB 11800 / UQM 2034) TaxID=485918 RepID=A0A979FZ75_CHIPD|nr:cytochrome c peroxidase [Chitinophaga pinensis]ACU57849.1 Cytochrome-c peroxidase [Chitinophaga pinensis DSM 2588]
MKKWLITGLLVTASTLLAFHSEEPLTRVTLGEKLFFDPVLSMDRTVSCASCHRPQFAFADTSTFSKGIHDKLTKRNTPALTNQSGRPSFFWDGRAATLEEQAKQPIISPDEMGLPIDEAVKRLNADSTYVQAFRKIFNSAPTEKNLLQALAAFERTLETANSPYDRYINGDDNAISATAARGRLLFIGKANCNNCHSGEDFTADRFKNIGLYNGTTLKDAGRFDITHDSAQLGFFKVPSLRNVAVTAPYMHNGMFRTLREVIVYYNTPDALIHDGIKRDLSLNTPLNLTDTEIDELEAFLKTLTDDRFINQ